MSAKNRAAVALGKLGGKSGTGAAKVRTTSFNSARAKAAANARWAKSANAKVSEPGGPKA